MQSAYNQDFEQEVPRLTWIRGHRYRVVTEPELREPGLVPIRDLPPPLPEDVYENDVLRTRILEQEHPVLVGKGKGEKYEPLADEPEAYLKFAAVTLPPFAAVTLPPRSDKECEEAAVRFAEGYGLPRDAEPFRARGSAGLPLDMFLSDSVALAFAVRELTAATSAELRGDFRELRALYQERPQEEMSGLGPDGTLLFHAKYHLTVALNEHLAGVRLSPVPDISGLLKEARRNLGGRRISPPSVRILQRYSCDSLLTAMWLQVYFAATEPRIVRLHCKGCGQPFEAKDIRQEYCERYCRHAANQRSYYRRQGGKEKP